jgi:AmpE protein
MKLLAIIIAFGLFHYVGKPAALRSFGWLELLQKQLKAWFDDSQIQTVLMVILPLLLLWVLEDGLMDLSADSVGYLLLSILLLYYCLGPNTLAADLHNSSLRSKLKISDESTATEIIYALTDAALHRWFGVFFWYVVLGIYGALLYRVVCWMALHSNEHNSHERKTAQLLEFPVTVFMTVSLAIASDFDRVWKHCKQYLNQETLLSLNSLFLYKSMDFAVGHCEIETKDEDKAHITEQTTFLVLKKMLVVWLVFVALLVLFTQN